MKNRAGWDPYHSPINIYELHLGTWRRAEDGRIYKIDEIVTVRETEVAYTGRRRERYVVKIRGQMCSLFFERTKLPLGPQFGRWYVERKTDDSGRKTA